MSTEPPTDIPSIHSGEPPLDAPSPSPSRLRRSRDHRVVAGVAGAIAERFDVNENLVRAIFMALTFLWGLGLAIYLVLWAVLGSSPIDGDDSAPRQRTALSSSHRLSLAILAGIIVATISVFAVFSLGHPFHHLEPGLAIVWIFFLAGLAIVALKTQARRLTLRRFFAVMFLSALSFLIVVVGAGIGFLESTGVALAGGNGEHVWQPTTLQQVAHVYRVEFGVGTLDLTTVRFPTSGFLLSVSVAAGVLRIVVPRDAVVDLTTNVGAGTVTSTPLTLGDVATVPYSALPTGVSESQVPRNPHVTIDARVGAGVIDLMRAS